MAPGSTNGEANGVDKHVQLIPLSFTNEKDGSHDSALQLVLSIRPEWADEGSRIEFVRFTDGITNTLLKALNRRDGLSDDEVDREAILLRAYGHGTDLIIDRQREAQNHELLSKYGLAPELLARFHNGMMYRYISGKVTHPEDLRKPVIYRAVASRLAEWHATVPCINGPTGHSRNNSKTEVLASLSDKDFQKAIDGVVAGKPSPNVWTVMQKWIFALPTETEAQRSRQAELQKELEKLASKLSQRPGLGKNGVSGFRGYCGRRRQGN
jgi:ethanolamine kinase